MEGVRNASRAQRTNREPVTSMSDHLSCDVYPFERRVERALRFFLGFDFLVSSFGLAPLRDFDF